jgi:enoyl-CoA hydratase
MAYQGYDRLEITSIDNVVTATIVNAPTNAIDPTLHHEIERFFHAVNADAGARAIVFTGAGDASFSSGGDIAAMVADLDTRDRPMWTVGARSEKALFQALLNLTKPLIARVNGDAMGLGATLAVLADVSVMVEDARIADSHVKVGLAAGDGGSMLWPLMMGFAKARRYLLTGDAMTGATAAELGLVTHAVPRDQLDATVARYAQRFAKGPAVAIGHTKMAINLLLRSLIDSQIEAHYGLEVQSALSEDHREAVTALAGGRKPQFTGH